MRVQGLAFRIWGVGPRGPGFFSRCGFGVAQSPWSPGPVVLW